MSFFSRSISSAPATTAVPPARSTRPAPGPAGSAPSGSVTVDTLPPSPPPQVLDAIGAAAGAYDRLASSGQHLHFEIDPPTGKVAISVTDLTGNVLHTLSPSAALAVASGQPLPER